MGWFTFLRTRGWVGKQDLIVNLQIKISNRLTKSKPLNTVRVRDVVLCGMCVMLPLGGAYVFLSSISCTSAPVMHRSMYSGGQPSVLDRYERR